jgi:hypothetical protein
VTSCDNVTCKYCCIDYANGQECENDVFRCKMDKKDNYQDLYLLIGLLAVNL